MPPHLRTFSVKTPASIANIGAGFDCLALAVDLKNEYRMYFNWRPLESGEGEFKIILTGLYGKSDLKMQGVKGNLFVDAFDKTREILCDLWGLQIPKCPTAVYQVVRIPPMRGLGSSSSACVAGVILAIRFLEAWYPKEKDRLNTLIHDLDLCASLAMASDNCPDNVCASLAGGLTYSFKDEFRSREHEELELLRFFHEKVEDPDLRVIALVPNLPLSTEEARDELRLSQYSSSQAAFNISRSTCLPAIFRTRRYHLLREATKDRIHQRQRSRFYRSEKKDMELDYVFAESIRAGAYGACISGAGSSLVAFASVKTTEAVMDAFGKAFLKEARGSWAIESMLDLSVNNVGVEEEDIPKEPGDIPDDVNVWLSNSLLQRRIQNLNDNDDRRSVGSEKAPKANGAIRITSATDDTSLIKPAVKEDDINNRKLVRPFSWGSPQEDA